MSKDYNAVELKKFSVEELKAKAIQLNDDIFKTRVQQSMGSVKNLHATVSKRKDLARIYTVLNAKLRGAK
jgi:large subunit ribosomal protein L29